jgi:hypothetical protein
MDQTLLYLCVAATLALLLWDSRQTLDIKNHPGYTEINILLGKHPGDIKIIVYFILASALYAYVALQILTGAWLYVWLAGWAAMEIWCIQNNLRIGLKF